MKKEFSWVIFTFFILSGFTGESQNITISGHITDAQTGEDLIGATIYNTNAKTGTTTNNYGFYSITISTKDTLGMVFSYIGYAPQTKKIAASQSLVLNIDLAEANNSLGEVVVNAKRNDNNVSKAQVGVVEVPLKQINTLPAIGGESDVLKVIQLLPGVQSGKEGTTGFHVRGGNIDQNLVLLDEATIYNPNHLFGLFSTFNTNAINHIKLIKGGFPAEYGGRLSSILEITMKEGNKNNIEVNGGIGLLASNLSLEGPINKGKGSFIVSGRRSYIDILLKPFIPKSKNNTNYYLYDYNAKVNYSFSDNDRVYLSYFAGLDDANYTGASSLNYRINFGNKTATLRWNHLFNNKIFTNTSIIYNNYHNSLSTAQGNYQAQMYSGIKDLNFKTDWEILPNPNHIIKVGANFSKNTFLPATTTNKVVQSKTISSLKPNTINPTYSSQLAFYLSDEIKMGDKLGINLGLRAPIFLSSTANYSAIEPRVTLKYSTGKSSSVKLAYTEMNQFLHLVPSSSASLPTDIWISSSDIVKPEVSRQYSLGWFKNFNNNAIETSVEVYYKTMSNQVLFKEGTQPLLTNVIDKQLTFGKGESYGIEFFAKKNFGRLTGWASYTLSWANQTFSALNYGKTFPYTYDKRHNISLVATYELNNKWTFAADWVFTSGGAYTLPLGKIPVMEAGSLYDGYYYDFESRNNYRYRPYHRLDVNFIHKNNVKRWFGKKVESEWVVGVYNLYSRMNPYFVYLTVDPVTQIPSAKEVSLLPILPTLSWNFKF
ncbi:MAG: TonB-dependent receptor [Draconibacterium sp.]|nr:TonB-dependent receptor [Draconibacterium sp.]